MKTVMLLLAFGWTLSAHAVLADERSGKPGIVAHYDAPPECPSADAFTASVQAELAARPPSHARPLQVSVTISRVAGGYSADATALDDQGSALERTVQAPTCDEMAEIVAALVALAQTDSRPGDRAVVAQASPSVSLQAAAPAPATEADLGAVADKDRPLTYAFSLGYGAFAVGPANPVIRRHGQQTTFNPAQGARLGFGVSHAFGWWKPSLEVSAAYYRQGTTTVNVPSGTPPINGADGSDRDVLHGTIDACPVRLEYRFLSLLPCLTFSMIQSRGNSGNDPGLETGLGGSLRLRPHVLRRRPGLRRGRDLVVRAAVERRANLRGPVTWRCDAMTVAAHDSTAARRASAPTSSEVARPADRERLAGVVREHIDFVWRVLRRQGLSAADADDGVQRVFLVFRERGGAVAGGAEKGFLFRVACYVATEFRRSVWRFEELDDANSATERSPAERIEAVDLLDKVTSELDEIGPFRLFTR